jgi:hypothetical protein
MYDHYAHVIVELEGEPRLSAVEQIERARKAVNALEPLALDKLMDDLMVRPSAAAQNVGAAAGLFFDPDTEATIAEVEAIAAKQEAAAKQEGMSPQR